MTQRIEYAFFPGVRDEMLWPTINKVLGHVHRSQLAMRDFRDWLKDAGLWQKDEAGELLALLDVQTEPAVKLGPWAEQVFAAKDDAAARDLLYKRLCDENVLLVKYVLEALDVDGGGRLHSTSELHRMLTSYVYPGKHVGRVAFEAWIKWVVASGRVKLIGIRWGLTDLGKQAVPRLRTVDADEFLEDEAALVNGPTTVATTPIAPSPAAAKAVKPAPSKQAAEEDEEMPDAPPEAEPIDPQTFAVYEAQLAEPAPPPAPVARKAAPVAVAPTRAPAAAPRQSVKQTARPEGCGQPALDPTEIAAALRDVAKQRGLNASGRLQLHGLDVRMAQNEAARHLFLAALLARVCLRPQGDALAAFLHERAGGWGPVALLLDRPEALVDCLMRWGLTGNEPQTAQLRALLLEATLGGRALKAQPELPKQLAEAGTPEQLLTLLGQGVLRAATYPEQFWLVREMVQAGLWTHAAAREVAFVPSRPVRLMAYRLRLIESHFAETQAAFLQIARALAPIFPAGSVEVAALEALAPDDSLRLDCPRVLVCATSCAVGGD